MILKSDHPPKRQHLIKLIGCCLAAAAVVFSAGAFSQDSTGQIEEIVVQGTATGTGIRGVAPVGSQTLTLSRETLLESPVRNAAEIIRDLPQGSQQDTGITSNEGSNATGNRGINLRGLGTNTTLMMLDGHRIVGQGANSVQPDPTIIPFAAIEAVEVVLDGASSVYGSDAVAGVVNFRMRRDFEGVDVQVSGSDGLADTAKVELVGGWNIGNSNLMIGLTKEYRTSIAGNARDYFRQDLTPYGGTDLRTSGSRPTAGPLGLIRASSSTPIFGIPATWTGVTVTTHTDPDTGIVYPLSEPISRPTLAEIQAAPLDIADAADYSYYQGSNDQRNAFVRWTVDLTDTLKVDYTGMVSNRQSNSLDYGAHRITVTPYSPYWIPGLTTRSNYTVLTNPIENGLRWYVRNFAQTSNHYVDITWDIDEWQMTSSIYSGKTRGSDISRPERNVAALGHDPAGTPEGYFNYAEVGVDASGFERGGNPEWFNPYLQGPTHPDQPEYITKLSGDTLRWGEQWMSGASTRLEGPLMDIAGGTIRGSIGAEYRDENHWLWLPQTVRYYPDPNIKNYDLRDTTINREVGSIFAEVYLPLVSDANAMPGVQRFAVNLSVRKDRYSDMGETTNPRLGVSWDVNDDLSFRFSAGSSFLAPTLEQVNPGTQGTLGRTNVSYDAAVIDADIPLTRPGETKVDLFNASGKNPFLGPETADMWSVGIDYSPYQVEGLRTQLTYYSINYTNKIGRVPGLTNIFKTAADRALLDPYLYKITQPATCVNGALNTYAPELLKWLTPEYGILRFTGSSDDCDLGGLLDSRLQNIGTVDQKGVDIQVSYDWDTDMGTFRVSGNLAKILSLDEQFSPGTPTVDNLDRIGYQTSTRFNARLGWIYNDWSAALTSKTEGSYENDQHPSGDTKTVDAWTTFDATVSYRTPDDGSLMGGISASLGIQNLTDKEPPIVLTDRAAFDSGVHSPFGRSIRLELGKSF